MMESRSFNTSITDHLGSKVGSIGQSSGDVKVSATMASEKF